MGPWSLDRVDEWLDWIHRHHDEFGYRYIYFAYLAARVPEPRHGEITMTVNPDGSCLLRAGGHDRGLFLAGDRERVWFVERFERRYCGDWYPSMQAWEAAQHEDFLEEAQWRFGSASR
ncbi:hypothetical protein SAMN05444858_12651 [Micromonospora avicenniae]|uniref:Uncharacterized protein n=1 Tax=Micromonospora avicenniae TaxID=1198245 RepID=A0A1N7ERE3_9ACTN|nr:hypothetical protein SAMN05444858_12651 [Micromonospora avicenniae]